MPDLKRSVGVIIIILMIALGSCTPGEYKKTNSGLKYKYVKNEDSPSLANGNVILMNISYLDDQQRELFNSNEQSDEPLALSYVDSLYNQMGGIEEGIRMLSDGDSMVLQFPIEDLYERTFNLPLPDTLTRGSLVTVCIGAVDVLSMPEYQAYSQEQYARQMEKARQMEAIQFEKDEEILDEFLNKEDILTNVHESGLRYRILVQGKGPIPESGQQVSVNYTGRLLNGNIFDTSNPEVAKSAGTYNSNREPYQPYSFRLGTGSVIQGWDIGIGLINQGTKAELYIPSRLGYGPRGMGRDIPPNSILVFDVELVSVGE